MCQFDICTKLLSQECKLAFCQGINTRFSDWVEWIIWQHNKLQSRKSLKVRLSWSTRGYKETWRRNHLSRGSNLRNLSRERDEFCYFIKERCAHHVQSRYILNLENWVPLQKAWSPARENISKIKFIKPEGIQNFVIVCKIFLQRYRILLAPAVSNLIFMFRTVF